MLLNNCTAPCNQTLECGHICQGTCSQCHQGRLHVPCKQKCNQTNICGHLCEEPCNQVCPPCKKLCEVKCQHSRCSKRCGEPCVPCKEACSRSCAHGRCSHACGARCSRAACGAACERALPCGHRCRGLCGEPCPAVCSACDPAGFPTDFLGDAFGPDDKFVLLEDCNHVLELNDMDNLMFGDKETVSIRTCPYCRKPIINTHRYKDFINDMFKNEINPIKLRVYGTNSQILKKNNELKDKVDEFKKIASGLDKLLSIKGSDVSIKYLLRVFKKLSSTIETQKKTSLLQLEMQYVNLDILCILGHYYNQYINEKLVAFKNKMTLIIKEICIHIHDIGNTQKISVQQQNDIENEIKRIHYIILFAKLMRDYTDTDGIYEVKKAKENVISALDCWTVFDENNARDALKKFQETLNISGIIAKRERELVVTAIGLKAGHWFKCPNGHFYCIGDCGGAMQVAKCIECGASVGGNAHRLLETNSHAPEMDNSKFPAWSVQNNMANFDFN